MLFKIALTMFAFAANSVLCRLALANYQIDPILFSLIRVVSGAVVLWGLYIYSNNRPPIEWKIQNALFLAVYMLAFSWAYLKIDAGVGALLLFGTVQLTMVLYGILKGEKLNLKRSLGLILAFMGLVVLLLPNADAPGLSYALVMVISGVAWAAYSIAGKTMSHPLASTLANFVLAIPLVAVIGAMLIQDFNINLMGVVLAVLSGGLASSAAYVLWYSIVKQIDRITASTVQLSVPCLAILGGAVLIGEAIGLRVMFSTVLVLCGILLVIFAGPKKQ